MKPNCYCIGCLITRSQDDGDYAQGLRHEAAELATRQPRPFIIVDGVTYINTQLVKDAQMEINE